MSKLADDVRARLAFDETNVTHTAQMIVKEIESLAWSDNWTVHRGIPLVTERFKFHHARTARLTEALCQAVEALEHRNEYSERKLDEALAAVRAALGEG